MQSLSMTIILMDLPVKRIRNLCLSMFPGAVKSVF